MDRPTGQPTDKQCNSDVLGVYHRTTSELMVKVYRHHGTPCWQQFGSDPDRNPTWCSGTIAITNNANANAAAIDVYIVEVKAASHCLKQLLISCRYSIDLLRWRGKVVVYSWNSPTCTWPWIWPTKLQTRVFVCRNTENIISNQDTLCQGPRREEAGCWVSWA
jgi:hypothetical protein